MKSGSRVLASSLQHQIDVGVKIAGFRNSGRLIMKTVKSLFVAVAIAGTFCLMYSAVSSHALHGLRLNTAGGAGVSGSFDSSAAESLSHMFREVAKNTLPAVVSIQTSGKMTGMGDAPSASPFGDDPFGDSPFRDHPFFRDFFDRLPEDSPRGGLRSEQRRTIGQGSGFIIDPSGVILTNAHVVRGADEVRVQLSDGREFKATEIKLDDRADLAIVRISVREKLPFLTMGSEDEMEIGDWVLAIGSPFGLHRTVTQGIISAKSRGLQDARMKQEFLQTDAAINPGNSGGPLVNLRGEVIGVNTAISTSSGGYDGVGFAVPASLAKWVAEQLQNGDSVKRAYLGVLAQDIDSGLAESLGLETPHGVLVAEITKGSPAEKAELQIQDVITELNGQPIINSRKLASVAEKLKIGEKYPLAILRNGKKITLEVTVAQLPERLVAESNQVIPDDEGNNEGAPFDELGISVRPVTPEIAQQLNMDDVRGVVITSVKRDSYASQLGIQAGDVILRLGRTDVNTAADVKKGIEGAIENGRVLLYIRTAEGTRFLSVPFAVKP